MSTVNEKMTALADEIRELSGTTTSKSIDAMKTDIDAANAEIAEQAELLTQIATALEGKAGGSNNTARVPLKATLATIWYVGINGLTQLSNSAETVEIIIPSICLAQSSASLTASITGHCEQIASFDNQFTSLAFYITGDTSLEVMATGHSGGAA